MKTSNNPAGRPRIDLSGQRFGRLRVLGYESTPKGGKSQWFVVCGCGVKTVKIGSNMRSGATKSCGCMQGEKIRLARGRAARNRVLRSYKHHAEDRQLVWEISDIVFDTLTSEPCFYCGATPANEHATKDTNGSFIYNGIDRTDSSKGYTLENVVPCCAICNRAKMAMSREDFLAWVERVHCYQNQIEEAAHA